MVIKTFKTARAIEHLMTQECMHTLGEMVYTRVSHFANNKFTVKFCLSRWVKRANGKGEVDIAVLVRDATVSGVDVLIDFPTRKQMDKELKKRGFEEEE